MVARSDDAYLPLTVIDRPRSPGHDSVGTSIALLRDATRSRRRSIMVLQTTQDPRIAGGAGLSLRAPPRIGRSERKLARSLGWFSVGLGLAEVLTPKFFARLIGVNKNHGLLLALCGMREIAVGLGLITRRRPAALLWSRVAGDILDLSLLGVAFGSARNHRDRVLAATAAVVGVTALDVVAARRMTAIDVPGAGTVLKGGRLVVEKTLGINASTEDAQRLLDELPAQSTTFECLADIKHAVHFEPAPRGRGSIMRVSVEVKPRGGVFGSFLKKAVRKSEEQLVYEDMRKFKQLLEAGEVATTEGQTRGAGRAS
jgi:hypothetical protein